MEKGIKFICCLTLGIIILMSGIAFAQEDKKGCTDHPLFSRMPNYYIKDCKQADFDAYEFWDPDTQGKRKVNVEGKKYHIWYYLKDNAKAASALEIRRNYANAVKKLGGTSFEKGYHLYTKFVKDKLEIWADLDSYASYGYSWYNLTLVEKGEMTQEVVADAKFIADGISSTGHVAIYGIYFDFNKADVKPESDPALQEIAKLLQQDSKLKLYVVGHTDNVGGLDYNMKLSQQRAEAVVKELVSKYKIATERLKAGGVGPLALIASNDNEEGKAKNRRVELVKQ